LSRIVRSAALVAVAVFAGVPAGARAQSMQSVLNQLFVFGSGQDPLFLAGSAGYPDTQVHGNHFIPSAVDANSSLLGVFNAAIGSDISNFPRSSTVASQTFSFVGGVPTPTSNSFGPIFAERAQTLGRGRFDVAFSYSSIQFSRLRGIPMDGIQLNFLHENVDFPGCDDAFGGDCTLYGIPPLEHDVIRLDLDLRIQAKIYAFNATFGVTDWLDVGVAVPVVGVNIDGSSTATVIPSDVGNIAHFFGGTPENPILSVSKTSTGSTRGIGDVAARTKFRILDGEHTDAAILGEVRLPTGREEDFLGTGHLAARGMFIASSTLGDFGPHVNFGYMHRTGSGASDSFQFATGFDQRFSDWATFIVDLIGDIKTEDSPGFPPPVTFDPPIVTTVQRTNIPNIRDDLLDGSIGFKFRTQGGVVLWTNALVALNDGGLRAGLVGTFGLQYSSR
jgi:hypothetical protein